MHHLKRNQRSRLGPLSRSSRRGLIPLGALVIAFGCSAPDPESIAPVRTLSPSELANILDESPVIIDVRDRVEFDAGHIAGATWLDPNALRANTDGIDGQVVSRAIAEATFGQAGLMPEDPLVVTAQTNGTTPARVAWTLRYYGHRGTVGLLDGGLNAWLESDRPVVDVPMTDESTEYRGLATRERLRVDQAWVLEHLDDTTIALFDVRSAEEFANGHIPGAINVDWTRNLSNDGVFVPPEQIRALHGEPSAPTLVVYCQTGSRAAVSWALLRAAGYEDVRLYDGSWSEWGSDPSTPKA